MRAFVDQYGQPLRRRLHQTHQHPVRRAGEVQRGTVDLPAAVGAVEIRDPFVVAVPAAQLDERGKPHGLALAVAVAGADHIVAVHGDRLRLVGGEDPFPQMRGQGRGRGVACDRKIGCDGLVLADLCAEVTLDEYEVIRLVDLEKKTHEQCAAQMDISRTTVTEIYETAREKIARCIVLGQRLVIAGGNYRLCEGREHTRCGKCCCRKESKQTPLTSLDLSQELPAADRFNSSLPKSNLQNEGDIIMKIAVTYENGEIFQHFGHTETFKIYDIADGKVVSAEVVDTNGSGHGALAGFLVAHGVDTLICGGIGGGAQNALAQAGIRLFGGVSGNADEAVNALLAGNLGYNPNVHCDHHDHEAGHSCGDHGCGSHSCH